MNSKILKPSTNKALDLFHPVKGAAPYPQLYFGTWRMAGPHFGPYDQADGLDVLKSAFDDGYRHFDTAAFYGNGSADRLLAKAIRKRRDEVFISAKGALIWDGNTVKKDGTKLGLRQGLDSTLKSLQTDYIDLFFLHWPDPNITLDESIEALISFKEQGLIRHWGLSNLSLEVLEGLPKSTDPVVLQLSHNLLKPATEFLTLAKEKGFLNMIYSPLAEGLLGTSKSSLGADGLSKKDFRRKSPYFTDPSFLDKRAVLEEEAKSEGLSLPEYAYKSYLQDPLIDMMIIGPRSRRLRSPRRRSQL